MLNFKKAGIFSRGTGQEDAYEQEEQGGGVLAVWGSPGSGKTTVAVRLAKYLADKRRNVILLLCDMTAPMLPCICPVSELECERSLGSVLAAAHVSENLVKNNLVTHKRLGYLTMLGMLKGENEYTYPPYNEVQARELIDCLREIAPYVVIDCGSYIANDILSAVALMEADSVLRLANADLKSISYHFKIEQNQLVDGKYRVKGRHEAVNPISESLRKRFIDNGMPREVLTQLVGKKPAPSKSKSGSSPAKAGQAKSAPKTRTTASKPPAKPKTSQEGGESA